MDMAANMIKAVRRCFGNAEGVINRFHVQKLAYDAVQEARIKYHWEALDEENKLIDAAKKNKQAYQPEVLSNGDTFKQLLARSRYLLFKHRSKWTGSQKARVDILFPRYPNNRSTNAAAESFNAKLKAFRASSRGVTDTNFFLFRLAKISA